MNEGFKKSEEIYSRLARKYWCTGAPETSNIVYDRLLDIFPIAPRVYWCCSHEWDCSHPKKERKKLVCVWSRPFIPYAFHLITNTPHLLLPPPTDHQPLILWHWACNFTRTPVWECENESDGERHTQRQWGEYDQMSNWARETKRERRKAEQNNFSRHFILIPALPPGGTL